MKHRPTDLRSIIKRDKHLQQLLQRAGDFHSLTGKLQGLLPSGLSAHLTAAIAHDQVLVLFTDSPAWATRLRFAAPGLRAALGGFREVQVRVVPAAGAPPCAKDSSRQKAHLSAEAAEQIRIMAATISDPDLRQALNRLAAHGDDKEY